MPEKQREGNGYEFTINRAIIALPGISEELIILAHAELKIKPNTNIKAVISCGGKCNVNRKNSTMA